MNRKSWATLIGAFAGAAVLFGCGGAGGGGPVGGDPGGSGGGGALDEAATARVDVNAQNGQVTVTPLGTGSGGQSRSVYTGSAVSVTSTPLSMDASEVTLRKLKLTLKNNTTDTINAGQLIVDKVAANEGALDLREFSNVATIVGPGSSPGDGPGPSVTISQPTGVARDVDGTLYMAGSGDGSLRKYSDGFVTRIATGIATPGGAAVTGGSVFLLEQSAHNLVRVPTSGGNKFVMAGNGTPGLVDGSGAAARFSSPRDIELIGSTAFISDFGNDRIRTATNLAGGSATVATLNVFPVITGPSGLGQITLGGINWLVVTSTSAHKVFLVNSANGQSFAIAGTGTVSTVDGPGNTAAFNTPFDATVSGGSIFVTDLGGRRIRQLSLNSGAQPQFASSWMVRTVAGEGTAGSADGPGNLATFASPRFMATDGSGALIVGDLSNNRVRKVTAASGVFPITGSGGAGGTVSLVGPDGFIPDPGNLTNRRAFYEMPSLSPHGQAGDTREQEIEFAVSENVGAFSFVVTLSGHGSSGGILDAILNTSSPISGSPNVSVRTITGSGEDGFVDGSPMAARFNLPYLAQAGNAIYVADFSNDAIRRIDLETGVTSTIAGVARVGATGGGSGTTSRIMGPVGIWINADETEGYVTSLSSHVVLRLSRSSFSDPNDSDDWDVAVIAGTVGATGLDSGPGNLAKFASPRGIAVDPSGSLIYLADSGNNQVRTLTITGSVDRDTPANWAVGLFAGGAGGEIGDVDGVGVAARFRLPGGLALSPDGNIYMAEMGGNRVRRISPNRAVATIAGPTELALGDVDGVGAAARFNQPMMIAIDPAGFLYVTDSNNAVIRRVDPVSLEVRTVAGRSLSGGHIDGNGLTARFSNLRGAAFVPGRGLFVGAGRSIRLIERVIRNGQP